MKRQRILFIATVVLICGTAGALLWFRTHQRLGTPGIRFTTNPGAVVVNIDLPANVLNYTSTNLPQDKTVLDRLPPDTSYARRGYRAPDRFECIGNIILMGTDRTSIHKPEYCLPGQGWQYQESEAVISIGGPEPYELPVAKWVVGGEFQTRDGQKLVVHGVYVFWFVADNELATGHWERVGMLVSDLLTTGVLQRWAYVSYFATCDPGQEEATFERMKDLIAASVPEFQVAPRTARATAMATQ